MNRREFIWMAGIGSAGIALSAPAPWRTFEVTTRVEVRTPIGITRIWVPLTLAQENPFQKTIGNCFHADDGIVKRISGRPDGPGIVFAEFPANKPPVLTVTSRVATRNWSAASSNPRKITASEAAYFLRPTKFLPTDGIVREKALLITKTATTDIDKARAIYEWIVENTYRNPKTQGCGEGNIRFMLESGDLGGKCADLNALYVGLARAAGLPARDVYGLRVAKSELGYKSLGTSSETVTKAQHCRAEVYLSERGWVPVDPADVRKVMLEESPGNRPIDDEMVQKARARLFGSWEMNWVAYNYAQDVTLPGSTGTAVHFLMYPQAETGEGRLNSLDAATFHYQITAREVVA